MNARASLGEITVTMPTFHVDQLRAYEVYRRSRFFALRAGRRWGKTDFDKILAADAMIKGYPVGWFAPDYKISAEAYNEIVDVIQPIKRSSSKVEGVIKTITGGRCDFWTLDNERAGRSRKYKLVIIDEGAFTDNSRMMGIWEKAIKPTLLDLKGRAVVSSNTNGMDPENFLYQICNDPKFEFNQFHAPTRNNPYLPAEEVAKLRETNHPLVYQQEYEAEFVDWSGVSFFALSNMTENDQPVEMPKRCDAVFATIDSATKTGKENDGTAVTFWALNKTFDRAHPLVLLDYDIVQIEGALLETWLPTVFERLEALARECGARMGTLGAWIEDKASGMILIQQANRRGWGKYTHPIDSKLTSLGKSERAISVSGYVYRGMVRIARPAFERVIVYKGVSRNHLLGQVLGFRIGDKDPKAQDDLLDCVCYGISIALGDNQGF